MDSLGTWGRRDIFCHLSAVACLALASVCRTDSEYWEHRVSPRFATRAISYECAQNFRYTRRMRQGRGSLAKVFWALLLGGALFYAVVVLTGPWAIHIGGRWGPPFSRAGGAHV